MPVTRDARLKRQGVVGDLGELRALLAQDIDVFDLHNGASRDV